MLYRLFLILLVAAAGLGVYKGVALSRAQAIKPPAPPPLAEPARSPYAHSIAATGIIESARENIKIATAKPGLVTQIFPKVGDPLKAGDPLFQLDDREAKARVSEAEAQLQVEAATLVSEQVLLSEAADQLARVTRPDSTKFMTEDEMQRRRYAVKSAESRTARSTAALAAARSTLATATTALTILTIRAPRDGRLLQLNLRPGEYANINPPEPLMVLGDTETLQIRADVDEQNAPLVELGRPATASIKGNATSRLPLTFLRIDPFVVPKKSLTGDSTERVDTRVLQVIFSLIKPPNQLLYVGQQVDVYIEIKPN